MIFANSGLPVAIDLFSGCGGLTQGLVDAGYRVLAAIELDKKARATYSLNHSDVLIAGEDIRCTDPEQVVSQLGLCPGELDLIAGCPPCQGFSRIRQRNRGKLARDPRNSLIKDFHRFVRAIRPRQIIMENVPGLVRYYAYRDFKRSLANLGYNVCDEILNASEFGVPQNRKRLVLIASLDEIPQFAKPTCKIKTVRDSIGKLPEAGISGDPLHDLPQRRSERIAALIRAIPKNGGSRQSLPEQRQLACHRRTDGFSDVYGRMAWDAPAPTITGGCYNPSKGRFLHPVADRAITLREAALLQGFPENYQFDVAHGREAISLMIGNALPPPFVAAHARALISKRH